MKTSIRLSAYSAVLACFSFASCRTDDQAGSEVVAVEEMSQGDLNDLPRRRFKPGLDALEKVLTSKEGVKDIVEKLVSDELRDVMFDLQSLARIYQYQDKDFAKFREDMKDIEDGVSEYQKQER